MPDWLSLETSRINVETCLMDEPETDCALEWVTITVNEKIMSDLKITVKIIILKLSNLKGF